MQMDVRHNVAAGGPLAGVSPTLLESQQAGLTGHTDARGESVGDTVAVMAAARRMRRLMCLRRLRSRAAGGHRTVAPAAADVEDSARKVHVSEAEGGQLSDSEAGVAEDEEGPSPRVGLPRSRTRGGTPVDGHLSP